MKTRTKLLAVLGMMLSSAATALGAQVTFQVNMSAQVALGNFDPASGTVSAAGGFNGWATSASPLAPSPGDPNIWTGTFDVTGDPGSTAEYKFVLNDSTWEGNVGPGGPNGNRTFTIADTDQTLPVVFFNNVTSGSTVTSDVTFQVDMSVQIALGGFDPAVSTVSVAGEFNGWSASDLMLTQSVSDPDLWVGTRTLTGAANSTVLYKFVMNGGNWEGNVGPGGAQNRALTLTSVAQTLPPVFFNNVNNVGQVSLGAISGGQLTLSWGAGPLIRLQTATDLVGSAWQDIPNTLGQGTATVPVPVGPGRAFFQLVGP